MKILLVNTLDRGGAANACLRLHEGLLREDVESKVLLKRKDKRFDQTFVFQENDIHKNGYQILKRKVISFLRALGILKNSKTYRETQFINRRSVGLELFSFPNSKIDITRSLLYKEADIIHLHWVSNFLDYESFFKKNVKPVVWTLHDMNPFTGGEHYMETYLGMDALGNPKQRTISEEEKQISNKNLLLKQLAIQVSSKISIVAPSKWLYQEALNSQVFTNMEFHHIPYGIDSEIYNIRNKDCSREILNIPKDKIVILFVADSISNHRKGYMYLKNALDLLQRDDVILCAVGSKKSVLETINNTLELGAINDERLMSVAYSAADMFVIPSLMDNLPNTVLESLMCGTPVVGFPVGGIVDMIKSGFNGLITDEVNVVSLHKTIELFLENLDNYKRIEIRNDALTRYDIKIQAKNYIKLYQRILNK